MKPSILVIADFPNWAYYEIQQYISNALSDRYDVYFDFLIYNTKKKSKNPIKRLKGYINQKKYVKHKIDKKYDVVFYLAFYFQELMNTTWEAKTIVKGIYTDSFPPSNINFTGTPEEFITRYFSNDEVLVGGSSQIVEFYSKYYSKVFLGNALLDDKLFFKKNKIEAKKDFIIGWTGNPSREFKGYYSHVEPVIACLKEKYPDVILKSRFSGPLETLPQFYEDVDLVLIASDADAGPAMFGEASLMGIPSISTDIGWPHQVIQHGINGFIVERNINDMIEKIELLYHNRELLKNMSDRIRKDYLKVFNKADMRKNWEVIFDFALNKR